MKTYFKGDAQTGLRAFIAIDSHSHDTAMGGCRMKHYASLESAEKDAKRLASAMTLKMQAHKLPYGGAKAVILEPDGEYDRNLLFTAFGKFVESLNGAYITATDIGSSPEDMDVIAKQTKHVTCTSSDSADPSPYTALTVFHAMRAAVNARLDQDTLSGVHVAIEGVGSVGYELAKLLHASGAKLTVCDIVNARAAKCAHELNANVVLPNEIYAVNCDVFSPCALGETLNTKTIDQLHASIICGGANCQLAEQSILGALQDKHIFYVPDYIANAGGIIHIARQDHKIEQVYEHVIDYFETVSPPDLFGGSIT